MAGVVGVLAAVALVAAPAALASGDTITTAAGVQFHGVIDAGPQCSDATSIVIHWGDGATSPGSYNFGHGVVGTHTYASAGSGIPGTVVFTGGTSGSCLGSTTPDTFTANVGATPQFTECP
ncbi:MAG TPA: hypothetical protein VGI55_19390, partial [Solirubrobacteraceae bacterium]